MGSLPNSSRKNSLADSKAQGLADILEMMAEYKKKKQNEKNHDFDDYSEKNNKYKFKDKKEQHDEEDRQTFEARERLDTIQEQ